MSATEELKALAVRKAALQARIAERRAQLRTASEQLATPVGVIERGAALWRSVPTAAKWAAIPAGIAVAKKFAPKLAGPLGWLKYAPVAAEVAKTVTGWRKKA